MKEYILLPLEHYEKLLPRDKNDNFDVKRDNLLNSRNISEQQLTDLIGMLSRNHEQKNSQTQPKTPTHMHSQQPTNTFQSLSSEQKQDNVTPIKKSEPELQRDTKTHTPKSNFSTPEKFFSPGDDTKYKQSSTIDGNKTLVKKTNFDSMVHDLPLSKRGLGISLLELLMENGTISFFNHGMLKTKSGILIETKALLKAYLVRNSNVLKYLDALRDVHPHVPENFHLNSKIQNIEPVVGSGGTVFNRRTNRAGKIHWIKY